MFIGSRSITLRSRIRSRNRLAEQNSRGRLMTAAGRIRLSLEERSPFLEEAFLPVVEVHNADTVLFADLRDRRVLNEVLAQDGNLLLTGIIVRPGHPRYTSADRQTPAYIRLVRPEDSKQDDAVTQVLDEVARNITADPSDTQITTASAFAILRQVEW